MTPGARLPKIAPGSLGGEQRHLYDAITGGRRAEGPQLFRLADDEGCLEGPFNAFLLQPRLGSALQELGSAVRYGTGLSDRCREIAILAVAAHWESEFEWYAHTAVARAAGLGDTELAAVGTAAGPASPGRRRWSRGRPARSRRAVTSTTVSTPRLSGSWARPDCSSC
jgi:4-carboxymuconolactone decarboxylase